MPRARWGTCLLAVVALIAGCGGDEDRAELTARQEQDLLKRLSVARTAAASGDVQATDEALDAFRGRVARLRRAGALDDETARALRTGALRVLDRAREDNPPAAPPPEPVEPAPTPLPAPEDDEKGKEKGKEGKGKGKGKDDEKGDD